MMEWIVSNFFGLPLCLLSGSYISDILLRIYSLTLLYTWPNHLDQDSLTLSLKYPMWAVPLR